MSNELDVKEDSSTQTEQEEVEFPGMTIDSSETEEESSVVDPIENGTQEQEEKTEVEDSKPDQEAEEQEIGKPVDHRIPKARLDKALKQIREEREEKARLQKELEEFRKQKPAERPNANQSDADLPPMPKLKDVDYYEDEYQKKLLDWNRKVVQHELKAAKLQDIEEQKKAEQAAKVKAASERLDAFYNEDAEYQELLAEIIESGETVNIPAIAQYAMNESEIGPQIDKYILQNRDTLLPQLNSMSPERQLLEIGRIEGRLLARSNTTETRVQTKQTARVSKAPDPIPEIRGNSKKSTEEEDLQRRFPGYKEN